MLFNVTLVGDAAQQTSSVRKAWCLSFVLLRRMNVRNVLILPLEVVMHYFDTCDCHSSSPIIRGSTILLCICHSTVKLFIVQTDSNRLAE